MKDKIEFNGKNKLGNFVNAPIFIGNFYVITNFTVVEDMDPYLDEGMGDVIFGKPFCKASCVEARRFDGIITIRDGDDNVTVRNKEVSVTKALRAVESSLGSCGIANLAILQLGKIVEEGGSDYPWGGLGYRVKAGWRNRDWLGFEKGGKKGVIKGLGVTDKRFGRLASLALQSDKGVCTHGPCVLNVLGTWQIKSPKVITPIAPLVLMVIALWLWQNCPLGYNFASLAVTREKTDEEFTEAENNKEHADIQATNILSQGLPRHIFNTLNQTETTKEIWENVELLMQGSSFT
ncbi:hypothetical protein Tco_0628734 [Tanacetum coccineum]|uniref:Uncharacterized protein n=1 Tax=Tanacetum coccineum TaxID=301880 RepID=A0ABQ4WR83_9ASTR